MSASMPICNQQKHIKYTLLAGQSKTWPVHATYVAMLSSDSEHDLKIKMDDGMSNFIKTGTGYSAVRLSVDKSTLEPAVFNTIEFENTSDETITFECVVSLGVIDDNRTWIRGSIQVDLSAPIIETPEAFTIGTDTAFVIPADARAKERIIQNNGDYPVWVGDSNVSAETKRGLRVTPGGIANINCWGAVYLIAEDGQTTVSAMQIRKL